MRDLGDAQVPAFGGDFVFFVWGKRLMFVRSLHHIQKAFKSIGWYMSQMRVGKFWICRPWPKMKIVVLDHQFPRGWGAAQ